MHDPESVLTFWFANRAKWFASDPAFDAAIGERFTAVHDAVTSGGCDDWLMTPRGRLAFVIVLDQFSRNMFRDSAQSFAWDEHALAVALDALDAGDDRAVPPDARSFLYLPLMHAEDLEMQERAVALYAQAGDADGSKFAEQHRAIIRRFGRFPHRNQALGRASTASELTFLQQPGSRF